jgi:hypothetical protein
MKRPRPLTRKDKQLLDKLLRQSYIVIKDDNVENVQALIAHGHAIADPTNPKRIILSSNK